MPEHLHRFFQDQLGTLLRVHHRLRKERQGSVVLTEVNEKAAAEGTVEAIEEAKAKLQNGEINVFDTSTFTVTVTEDKNVNATVDDEGHLTGYQADVDTDEAFQGDTEVVKDGAFLESEYRSAPYFDIQIDGIELLNAMF